MLVGNNLFLALYVITTILNFTRSRNFSILLSMNNSFVWSKKPTLFMICTIEMEEVIPCLCVSMYMYYNKCV